MSAFSIPSRSSTFFPRSSSLPDGIVGEQGLERDMPLLSSLNKYQAKEAKPGRPNSGNNTFNNIAKTKKKKKHKARAKEECCSSDMDDFKTFSDEDHTQSDPSISNEDSVEQETKSVQSRCRLKTKRDDCNLSKFKEVEMKLLLLQNRCDMLQQENENMKKDQQAKSSQKIADLKHRNSELVTLARRLEQKAKALHIANNKRISETSSESEWLEKEKKNFACIAAKMQSEHDQNISEKDQEIKTLKSLVQDLKKTLREAKSIRSYQEGGDTLASALKESQKNTLQMQKLAAARSKKVTIRSLSMPVTARQKVLENANRDLRRQLAEQEDRYRQVCNGASVAELKSELENIESKRKTLENEAKEAKIQTVNLESQLQIAKVETSDTNVKLSELSKSFKELQVEYSTVHKQLSIAIDERDAAITQCQEKSCKISEMEHSIETNTSYVRDYGDDWCDSKCNTHYQAILGNLQGKVLALEKQCQEQNETNRLLNAQLMSMVKNCPAPEQEKEITSCSEAEPSSSSPMQIPEHVGHVSESSPVNADEVDFTLSLDQVKNQQQITGVNVQVAATRNEDTEIEDFIEEELSQAMDNNGAGKLRVYLAKYSYDPFNGPNQSPEAELSLVAGDYVYVCSTMDEDGFFEGELMDGRRGLVPSNFLEPVHGEMNLKYSNMQNSRHSNGEISQSESSCASQGSGRLTQCVDVTDASNSAMVHGTLPYPRKLRVDKRLSHSLIIGWVSPQLNDGDSINEFHIFVNGEFRAAVSGTHQKAVVENIQHEKAYRIAVCAVSCWGISDKNLCVVSHGRSAELAATEVQMERVGASNARVGWTPSSSQHSHIVTVDEEQEIGFSPQMKNLMHMTYTVPAPAYRLTIGNLRPNGQYKVMVNVKGSSELSNSYARFTTPEAGPPDPPFSVQVEECQNANYFLITWLPVTLNTLGTSNGVIVKGYGIHMADTKVCEVQSPTIDQCTVRAQTLADIFKQQLSIASEKNRNLPTKYSNFEFRWNKQVPPSITIKTYAVNGQESDPSDPCMIPRELFSKIMDLLREDIKSTSPSNVKQCRRPPLLRSIESTDADMSFSSDISIPGLYSMNTIENIRNSRNSTDSSDSISRSQFSRTRALQETRIVPSIEITHDTSSDDDTVAPKSFGGRSSSNKALGKVQLQQSISSGSNSAKVVMEESLKRTHKNCDNDDAASVSSSHTSSSNGGNMLQKRGKAIAAVPQGAHVSQQRKLQRGESAEYSNSEDYMPSCLNGTKKMLISSSGESSVLRHFPEVALGQTYKHHRNVKNNQRWTLSGPSDDHSQGFNRSRSSSARQGYFHHGRPNGRRDIIRQSTMSSQSGSELTSEVESTYPIDTDKSKISLFVALYSYNPQLMSPNTDIYEEELNFKEGQLIKVFGTKDDDGFYYGVTHKGMRGYVPCNMVSEVQVDSMQMLHDLHERGFLPSASPDEDDQSPDDMKTKSVASLVQTGGDQADGSDVAKKKYFVALFDYDPRQLSPNIDVDVEISFSRDDIITVYGDMDDDGFYKGKLGEKEGLVPSNFLEEISEEQANAQKQKSGLPKKNNDVKPTPSLALKNQTHNHQNSDISHQIIDSTPTFPATTATVNPNRVDNAKARKTGLISRGKKLFKKLGNSQDGRKR